MKSNNYELYYTSCDTYSLLVYLDEESDSWKVVYTEDGETYKSIEDVELLLNKYYSDKSNFTIEDIYINDTLNFITTNEQDIIFEFEILEDDLVVTVKLLQKLDEYFTEKLSYLEYIFDSKIKVSLDNLEELEEKFRVIVEDIDYSKIFLSAYYDLPITVIEYPFNNTELQGLFSSGSTFSVGTDELLHCNGDYGHIFLDNITNKTIEHGYIDIEIIGDNSGYLALNRNFTSVHYDGDYILVDDNLMIYRIDFSTFDSYYGDVSIHFDDFYGNIKKITIFGDATVINSLYTTQGIIL